MPSVVHVAALKIVVETERKKRKKSGKHSRFEKYLDDKESFDEAGDGSGTTTVGAFIRKLLLEQVKAHSLFTLPATH